MPYRRRAFSGRMRGLSLRPVKSTKNSGAIGGGLSGTQTNTTIVKAVDAVASASGPTEVVHRSTIKAIWLSLDVCGIAGTGVLNNFEGYLIKNPGANLTVPAPRSVGTSNEKKFVIKESFYHGPVPGLFF